MTEECTQASWPSGSSLESIAPQPFSSLKNFTTPRATPPAWRTEVGQEEPPLRSIWQPPRPAVESCSGSLTVALAARPAVLPELVGAWCPVAIVAVAVAALGHASGAQRLAAPAEPIPRFDTGGGPNLGTRSERAMRSAQPKRSTYMAVSKIGVA